MRIVRYLWPLLEMLVNDEHGVVLRGVSSNCDELDSVTGGFDDHARVEVHGHAATAAAFALHCALMAATDDRPVVVVAPHAVHNAVAMRMLAWLSGVAVHRATRSAHLTAADSRSIAWSARRLSSLPIELVASDRGGKTLREALYRRRAKRIGLLLILDEGESSMSMPRRGENTTSLRMVSILAEEQGCPILRTTLWRGLGRGFVNHCQRSDVVWRRERLATHTTLNLDFLVPLQTAAGIAFTGIEILGQQCSFPTYVSVPVLRCGRFGDERYWDILRVTDADGE